VKIKLAYNKIDFLRLLQIQQNINEQTDKRTKYKRTNRQKKPKINEQTNKEKINEQTDKRTNGQANKRTSEQTNKRKKYKRTNKEKINEHLVRVVELKHEHQLF